MQLEIKFEVAWMYNNNNMFYKIRDWKNLKIILIKDSIYPKCEKIKHWFKKKKIILFKKL